VKAVVDAAPLAFRVPPELEATMPPELRGAGRDDVRLLVARRRDLAVEHHRFADLPALLRPGDVVVINTSATVAAAVGARGPGGAELRLHLSSPIAGSAHWVVEVRIPHGPASRPFTAAVPGWSLALPGGGTARLLERTGPASRLFVAALTLPAPVGDYLARYGEPIRYPHAGGAWPLERYQTVYATEPGSAEMASAGRAFTAELVTRLVSTGVEVAPLVLHAGVSSLEAYEPPSPERYRVPFHTARRANQARAAGGRVIAVGTTVVRALESVVDPLGQVHPGQGWTEVVVTPDRAVRAVDGLVTGWHEPEASHLAMIEAIAGRALLEASYREALEHGYRWHEFGDLHLILP